MEIRIEDVPSRRAGTLPHRGAYPEIGRLFGTIAERANAARLGNEPMVGIFYDHPDEVAERDRRSAAGVLLPEGEPCPAGLEETEIPAGRHLVAIYVGSYDGLPGAYGPMMARMERDGLAHGDGPAYELYENSSADVPESELRTAIHLPLA